MEHYSIDEDVLRRWCNVIRAKSGTTGMIAPALIPSALETLDGREAAKQIILRTKEIVTASDLAGVVTIGTYGLAGLQATTIELPETVTTISSYGLYDCPNVQSVVFPASVVSIGDYALNKCDKLESVRMRGETPPALSHNAFYQSLYFKTIYVPAGCSETYKQATNWSYWANRVEILEEDV